MAAPELRLEVSLGLNTFRSQMRQLVNIAQSEFTAQLNIRFNRRRLDDELNNLRRAIARRTYRIEIGGNLDAVPDKISTLKTRLKELEGTKINVPVTGIASITKKEARSLRAELKRQILAEGGKIKIPVVAEVQTRRGSTGGGFASSSQGAAGLFEYMRTQGMSGGNYPAATQVGRSERLKKALEDLTVKQLQALAKEQGIGGTSKLKKDPLIEKLVTELRQDVAEKILGDIKMQLNEGLRKNLDLVARGIFRMLGIDPQSLREKRLPSAINWQATAPTRSIPIGPSSTGRALPFGATPGVLPGSVFAQQKRLIGNRLDPELKEILRGAANTFVDSVRAELNAAVRSVSVRDLGNATRAALSPQRIAGLLPSGVGRVPNVYASAGGEDRSQLFARRTAEAYMRSAMRGVDVMAEGRGGGPGRPYSYAYRSPRPQGAIVPYERGAIVPTGQGGPAGFESTALPKGYLAAGQLSSALKNADQYLKQSRLPLTGAINELAGEFGFAVQQVLLFGTAYKGLAFFTNLPQQAFDAAKALQTFNNQLSAITGSASAAARASEFISSVVEQFNVPLQTARDGFVRLYASMQPAGISNQTIEGLFTGISKAAATLGLSSDQVDRVTYAFSQMASKGQIMSEEVSGQLGDVIPGALSIMAQAAGMSMTDFKDAMEKGQLSGKALEQVFANLEIVLDQRFGAGAEGAANTLQGVVNDMTTAMTRLYESFEPIVNATVSAFGPQIIGLITNATAAVQAFSASMQGNEGPAGMLSSNARAIYDILTQVAEIGKAVGSVFQQLAPVLGTLGSVVLSVTNALAQFVNTPVGSFLANWAAQTAIAMAAMQLLAKTGIAAAAAALVDLIRQLITGQLSLERLAIAAGGAKFALMGLGATAVLAGLTMLVSHLNSVYQKALDIQAAAKGAQQAIAAMSMTEATVAARRIEGQIQVLRRFQRESKGLGGLVSASGAEVTAMAAGGGTPGVGFTGQVINQKQGIYGPGTIDPTMAEAAIQKLEGDLAAARAQARPIPVQQFTPVQLAPGKEKTKTPKTKKTPLNELLDLESQRTLKLNMSKLMLRLEERIASARLAGNEEEADSLNNLREALKLRSELAQLQDFQKMLIDKESEIVGKSLSQAAYNNKLQDTNVAVEAKANELRAAYLDIQVKENAKLKDREAKQKEFVRLLEDVRIENGLISEEQAKQINLARQYEDALSRFPFLTEAQKLALRDAIYSQEASLTPLGERIKELRKELEKLRSVQEMVKGSAEAIGDSFAQSFKDTISGAQTAQQALASFFQRIGDYFLDMAARMIQKWIEMQILGLAQSLLPSAGGLLTSGLSGGFSTGSAFSMAPGAVPAAGGITMPSFTGGISGGIQGFANGGMVTGPTLGLVGEGRYNEAIVPLPDGKSIPVDLGGAAGNQIVSNITVNVNNGQTQSNATGANSSELGRKLEGAVKQVIVGELRPGGLLSR